jgi:diguanylate cyclase (GGDEF)-like protein
MLQSKIRPQDNVYRFGGEEFTILFINCLQETVILRTQKIIEILNNTGLGIKEIDRPVTCSFGITQVVITDTVDSVCIRADEALYQAKNNGRNQFVFKHSDA